jgi:phosphoglycerol transferase MdoB-like AlkP superfamily enzyme
MSRIKKLFTQFALIGQHQPKQIQLLLGLLMGVVGVTSLGLFIGLLGLISHFVPALYVLSFVIGPILFFGVIGLFILYCSTGLRHGNTFYILGYIGFHILLVIAFVSILINAVAK